MTNTKQITLTIIIGTALALVPPLYSTIQNHIADCKAYSRYIEDYNRKIESYLPYDATHLPKHITCNPNLKIKG